MTTRAAYPVTLEIDYPYRELDRLTTLLRPVTIVPIAMVLALISGPTAHAGREIVVEAGVSCLRLRC
jgi:hypothetical protein